MILSIPLPCGSPVYLRKVVGFFSDAGDMEEDEMEDFMEAAVELKSRVSLTCVDSAQIHPCYLVDPNLSTPYPRPQRRSFPSKCRRHHQRPIWEFSIFPENNATTLDDVTSRPGIFHRSELSIQKIV